MSTNKYKDVDLYALLGVTIEAEQAEIRKAYRKKALECHPDKNPDNPKAAERFHELSYALEILADVTARAAYDKVIKAKQAAQLRHSQLDNKRQKLKADLEQRERDALERLHKYGSYAPAAPKTDEEKLEEAIERLRREGSKLLEEEQRLMRERMQQDALSGGSTNSFDSSQHRIKIKWKSNKHDATNGGYNEALLMKFLHKYGDIEGLVVSKKHGSAMIEFKTLQAAEMAVAYEKGLVENPLNLEWLQPPKTQTSAAGSVQSSKGNTQDFESLVLRQLRQAEERKRLIAQMQKEDDEEEEKRKQN